MHTRLKLVLLTSKVVLGLFTTLIITRSDSTSTTLQEVDDLIKREIPIGASKNEVYEFLNSRKINSSGYDVGPDPLYGLLDTARKRSRYVTAIIPQQPDPNLSDYDIRIVFYFDENLRLIDYKLQQLDNVP